MFIEQLNNPIYDFAAACYDTNTIADLVARIGEAERGNADDTGLTNWGLTAEQYVSAMRAALKEHLADETLHITHTVDHGLPDLPSDGEVSPVTYFVNDRFALQRGTDGTFSIPRGHHAFATTEHDQENWWEALAHDAYWFATATCLIDDN